MDDMERRQILSTTYGTVERFRTQGIHKTTAPDGAFMPPGKKATDTERIDWLADAVLDLTKVLIALNDEFSRDRGSVDT